MLVNSIDVLEYNQGFAPAINVPSLTALRSVIEAAEEENVGIIVQHAESHEEWLSREDAVNMMRYYAKKSHVPIAVHFDHGSTPENCERAMRLGFTSVMYDGSKLPIEENIANTKKVVNLGLKYGVSVEAELGVMPDGDELDNSTLYTTVTDAERFVKETRVDMLAVSIGTAHGFYKNNPKINYRRIIELKSAVAVPLVMHGGSGLSKEEYIKSIESGISKINYYTYMSQAALSENTSGDYKLFEQFEEIARASMKKAVKIFINDMKGK